MSSCNIIMDACGFSISNKEAAGKNKEGDTSNISNSSCSGGKTMMMAHHHDNQHRPSPVYEICCGPTWNTSPNSNIYHAMASGLVSGSGLKTLQPFDVATTATSAATQTAIKSPGMAASIGFPFTNAQWKELERQAMIYKYMMASVPVPPDLFFPITTNSSTPLGGGLNLIRCSKGGDLEPGRCRRTDGKKWRCSRDVAPDQKYCERHLHRGRPRSRKHVEVPANKKKSILEPNSNTMNSNNNNNFSPHPFQFPGTFTEYQHIQSSEAATFQPIKEQRCLDLMMKGEHLQMHSSAGQEWQHRMQQQTRIEVNNTSVLTQHYLEHPLNLNSFTNFSSGVDQFINSELVSLEKQMPRGFIDAWSNGVSNEEHNGNNGAQSCSSSAGNLTLSPLSLSMGGPLAEVLRPSTVAPSGSPSPTSANGDSGSALATAVSSPSGVLLKTLASFSDSSGSSSPNTSKFKD